MPSNPSPDGLLEVSPGSVSWKRISNCLISNCHLSINEAKNQSLTPFSRNEIKQEIEKCDRKPKLIGFLANSDPAAEMYAQWTGKSCQSIGIEFELVRVERTKLEAAIVAANQGYLFE